MNLRPTTRKAYQRTWQIFLQWSPSTTTLPVDPVTVSNFIAYLFEYKYSPSTISSHISAIGFLHKVLNLQDPTQNFLVQKIITGCHKLGTQVDTRLPITGSILQRLLVALEHTIDLAVRPLLKALFLIAFHGFFRLGELVVKSSSSSKLVMQRADVQFEEAKGHFQQVQLVLRHYNTIKTGQPYTISIKAANQANLFPVHSLFHYLTIYKHVKGPLFQFLDGSPVTYSFVCRELNKCISLIGLNPKFYKCHSFRIGAATYAASLGFSENAIQTMGRWKSDAIKRYIRTDGFSMS